ncbi:MAG: hypothetical protein I8H98_11950 [Moraxellaceae bacterium]|nr:hypothetical protein [Moraxellaceae bacterium]MBH2030048.1 hypothetical protein [Moraxellaceae bacterium]
MYSYYKYIDTDGEITLYEVDQEYYCLRSIFVNSSECINTNLSIKQTNFFLPEGNFSESLDILTPIKKEEFLNFWDQSISKYLKRWNELKNKFKIGEMIETEIVCFYPQGVIVQYDEEFFGFVDYNDCKSVLGASNMYPQQKFKLFVENFDDDNLWVNFSIKSV